VLGNVPNVWTIHTSGITLGSPNFVALLLPTVDEMGLSQIHSVNHHVHISSHREQLQVFGHNHIIILYHINIYSPAPISTWEGNHFLSNFLGEASTNEKKLDLTGRATGGRRRDTSWVLRECKGIGIRIGIAVYPFGNFSYY
jgi:hypothetical protein